MIPSIMGIITKSKPMTPLISAGLLLAPGIGPSLPIADTITIPCAKTFNKQFLRFLNENKILMCIGGSNTWEVVPPWGE